MKYSNTGVWTSRNLWAPHAGRVKIELLVHLSRSPWLDWPINLWEDAYNYLHPVSLSSTTVVRHRPFLPLKLIVILHNSGEGKNVQNSTSLPMLSSLESVFEQFLMESNIFNSQAGLEITHFSSLFLVRNFQFDNVFNNFCNNSEVACLVTFDHFCTHFWQRFTTQPLDEHWYWCSGNAVNTYSPWRQRSSLGWAD